MMVKCTFTGKSNVAYKDYPHAAALTQAAASARCRKTEPEKKTVTFLRNNKLKKNCSKTSYRSDILFEVA